MLSPIVFVTVDQVAPENLSATGATCGSGSLSEASLRQCVVRCLIFFGIGGCPVHSFSILNFGYYHQFCQGDAGMCDEKFDARDQVLLCKNT